MSNCARAVVVGGCGWVGDRWVARDKSVSRAQLARAHLVSVAPHVQPEPAGRGQGLWASSRQRGEGNRPRSLEGPTRSHDLYRRHGAHDHRQQAAQTSKPHRKSHQNLGQLFPPRTHAVGCHEP